MPISHKRYTQPLKWPGGKRYLAPTIVGMLPQHLHYVEPYAGGAAVLLARDPNDHRLWLDPHLGVSEVLNDIDGELMNFWKVLKSPDLFDEFQRKAQAIPLARQAFDEAKAIMDQRDPRGLDFPQVERALAFFVTARQSRAGGFKGFTALTRNRLRRGINGNASEWLGCVDGLAAIHARLEPVVLECCDAIELIDREDEPGTFFYCDPPYLMDDDPGLYKFPMTPEQHRELLTALAGIEGKFMLSGYHSELYDDVAKACGWRCKEVKIPNQFAGGAKKRIMTECIWRNYL